MMKRFLLSILLSLLLLLQIACGGSTTEPTVSASDGQVAVEPTAPPEPTDEPTPLPTVVPTLPPPIIVAEDATEAPTEAPTNTPEPEPTATPEPTFLPPWPTGQFGYGIQSHAIVGDPAYPMDVAANQLGLDWMKVQLRWSFVESQQGQYDWGIWDAIVNEAEKQGLYLMFSVVTAPSWSRADGKTDGPPDNYDDYYNFLITLLERYENRVHAIEVWNEQNIIREWDTPEGAKVLPYIDFLAGAYDTIKTEAPDVIVISGALAPTGFHDEFNAWDDFIWMDVAIEAGLVEYADCIGVHHNGYNIAPDIAFDEQDRMDPADSYFFRGPVDNPHHSWSFKTTLDGYAEKVQAVDPDMQLCVTEFGYATNEGYDAFPEGFEYVQDNSLQEQADYIVQAYQEMQASGDVWLTFLFNLDFGNKGQGPTDDNVPYSIVDTNGAPRPAFFAIADMEKVR